MHGIHLLRETMRDSREILLMDMGNRLTKHLTDSAIAETPSG